MEYDGKLNKTKSGKTCQAWTSDTPHGNNYKTSTYFPEGSAESAKNYCRNPAPSYQVGPWCYTTDPSTTWEDCDIDYCGDSGCLLVSNEEKVDCGFPGIQEDQCRYNLCCWHPEPNAPSCYYAARPNTECHVSLQNKIPCGSIYLSAEECNRRGCCFGATNDPYSSCYYTAGKKPWCDVPKNERVECGFPGIVREDCEGNFCCYSEEPDSPRCYHTSSKGGGCYIPVEQRIPCGDQSFSPRTCRVNGCCYQEGTGGPNCYRSISGTDKNCWDAWCWIFQ